MNPSLPYDTEDPPQVEDTGKVEHVRLIGHDSHPDGQRPAQDASHNHQQLVKGVQDQVDSQHCLNLSILSGEFTRNSFQMPNRAITCKSKSMTVLLTRGFFLRKSIIQSSSR